MQKKSISNQREPTKSMTVQLESYITDHIEGRRKSPFVRGVLHGLSKLFKCGVSLRNLAFDCRLLKKTKVDIPVISIGNIIAGGTGKTALIQKLGKDLSKEKRVSVLLRGYRSEIEKVGGSLHLIDRSRITPSVCGDEAYLLWKSLPDITLFVGKDRRLNAQRAAYHEAELILLDDGMQYRRLHRDLEIVMLHADDLYGKGFYLPRGYLRDSPKRLKEADFVIINHVQDSSHFEELKKEVEQRTSARLIGMQMVPEYLEGREGEIWDDVQGKRAAVFCGLGKPKSFLKTIEKMGIDIADTLILPDHIPPTRRQLVDLAILSEEKGCEFIICSEKDWVKLPDPLKLSLPIACMKASMQVVAQGENYDQLLKQVLSLTQEMPL